MKKQRISKIKIVSILKQYEGGRAAMDQLFCKKILKKNPEQVTLQND